MLNKRNLSQVEPRIETGVTQFGTDWPGIFIRGDNAKVFELALEWAEEYIRQFGNDLKTGDELMFRDLISLKYLMGSCDINDDKYKDLD